MSELPPAAVRRPTSRPSTMRIALDIRPFLSRRTGVGVLFINLLQALSRLDRSNQYQLFSSSLKDRADRKAFAGRRNFRIRDFRIPVRLLNHLWHNYRFPAVEWFVGTVDVAHSPHPLLLPSRRARQVVTIHDLHFLAAPDEVRGEIRSDYPRLAARSAERASLIQTVSRFTRDSLVEQLGVDPGKIRIIGPGIETLPAPPPRSREANGDPSRGDFILSVGTVEPRKNLPALLRALAIWNERSGETAPPALVVAGGGRPDYLFRMRALANELGLADRVRFLGYVPREDLWSLYRQALALVVPSSLEGFCIPLLEAMSCGTPVVASPVSAIPEVAGDAALFADTGDQEAFAEALEKAVSDSDLREHLREKGLARCRLYSWEKSAEALLAMYEELHSQAGSRPRATREEQQR